MRTVFIAGIIYGRLGKVAAREDLAAREAVRQLTRLRKAKPMKEGEAT